ncbi:helix-turn-helix domain-containing protein [Legionella nagasakiensis]|uniref:helix-turn-helix domain-containing protein n=1 Tax=Legionella nagasakiensis TaxID=535290 RepID=UPI0010545AC3|nr:helix-turn-helix transcriptional regulator [Legionella nagasakiensis]
MDSPVPKRLKEARLAANISQKKLGIAAGMDEFSASARMNHYELGRHSPDYSMLSRIALVLNLPVAYFYAESDQLAEVISAFSQLSMKDKEDWFNKLMKYNR